MPLSYQKNSICEECIERNAILWCKVCELRFCIKCSKELHQVGTMQSHVDDGHFQFLHDDENTKSKQGHFHTKKNLGRHPMEENIQTKEEIRVGETTEENPLEQEELLFSSSSQSFNENFSSNSKTNHSYNLWGGWKGGAFGDTSASMDNSASWTSLTGSLSMDSTKSSSVLVENDLSLQSITKSLRSLSFAASGSSVSNIFIYHILYTS
jgi:hypothetical protein